MKLRTFLLIGGVAALGAGCQHPVQRAEFGAHVEEFNRVKTEILRWGAEWESWGNRTKNAICDIVAKNGPASKYTTDTTDYCKTGGEGNGTPPDPPEFG